MKHIEETEPSIRAARRKEKSQRSSARIAELEAVIDGLEERLKAAEYAARVNYDGWQQEIARSSCHAQRSAVPSYDQLHSVFEAAYGLCMGYDWNDGTAAKACGYKRKLLSAVNAVKEVPDFEGKYLASRAPKVRTSHHRNKEEAARLQELVDKRFAVSDTSTASHAQCQQERGWLIEWPEDETVPTRWWNPASGWMRDANKAMRFARECDAADYVAANTFVTSVRPTEHVFGLSPDCEGK